MTGPLATTWRALGTSATVATAEPHRLQAAVDAVRAELAAIDAACSRFRDDAELVALNASAGGRVRVSPLLFEALEVAVEAARATGGAVDPTVGAALERAGYDRDLAEIAPDGPPLPDGWAPGADWRSIVLDGATRTVLVPDGVRLDLGATAKALAADRGAAAAASATGTGVVLSLGGDVAVGGTPLPGGWPVALGDDHAAPNGPVVALAGGGLATSSTTVRRWRRGDQVVHHILDPTTGAPCPIVWRTVTVAASTCVQANVASTAAIVLGAEAPGWLARRRLPARLVRPGGEVRDGRRLARGGGVTAATIGALGDRSLWYLSRGTGAVSLVLLTVTLVLGIVDVRRWSSQTVPRFAIDGLHRTVSLLVLLTLAIHIVTSVLDPFAPIRLVDAIVPFGSGYRPVWLGLGALAFDLLVALVITSLIRARIGHRGWRAVHWAAYACWPLALVHGLGSGSDVRDGFLLPLSLACAVAVGVAVLARLIGGGPERPAWRLGGLGLVGAAGIALVVWLPSGPLAQGWAKRAGTPAAPGARVATSAARRGGGRRVAAPTAVPGTSALAGRLSEGVRPNGTATANLALHLRHGTLRQLDVRLEGTALSGGGISLTQGQMSLGTASLPDRYSGPVDALEGNQVGGTLTASGAPPVRLTLMLQIDRASGAIGGQATISSTVTG